MHLQKYRFLYEFIVNSPLSSIKALESTFDLDASDCPPCERFNTYIDDNLVYGKEIKSETNVDKLDNKLIVF